MTQQYIGTKIVDAHPCDKNGQPGYTVRYADGYVSWSPKAAFDEAYLPIGNQQQLPAWRQRLIGEYVQLCDRKAKLEKFMGYGEPHGINPDFEAMTFEEQQHLQQQLIGMDSYADSLSARIKYHADRDPKPPIEQP